MNHSIEGYFKEGCMRCPLGGTQDCKVLSWVNELKYLRDIVCSTDLQEEVKWGVPCYTWEGKNVLTVSAFKNYCAISFFKGILISDPKQLLVKPGPNSHASRLLKFTSREEIKNSEEYIRDLILQSIEVEKRKIQIPEKEDTEVLPEELIQKMNEDINFRNAFESLTPGRQRGYIIYFSQAKQPKTRLSRIEKYTPQILNGEGMHDHYKSRK